MTNRLAVLRTYLPGIAILIVLALLPVAVDLYTLINATYALIAGILALSLAFIWGVGGIFSFGQTVFFGLGGYAYGVVAINLTERLGNLLGTVCGLIIGAGLAAIAAALLGFFVFYGRVGSLYISIITLALMLACYNLILSTSGDQYTIGQAALGGFNGMQGIPTLLDLGIAASYWLVLVLAALSLGSLLWLRQAGFGRVFNAGRINPERTELLGYDIRQLQLVGFSIGGAIAGLAGVLHASWGNAISPAVFEVSQAILAITWVIVGGRNRLWGAFLGAGLLHFLSSYLSTVAQQTTPLILGAILIGMVLLLPEGLAPAVERVWGRGLTRISRGAKGMKRKRGTATKTHSDTSEASDTLDTLNTETLSQAKHAEPFQDKRVETDATVPAIAPAMIGLETQELQRCFGQFAALNSISLQFEPGKAYCIIGPNGAGKSTYFNLLTGRLQPTAGQIIYQGHRIDQLATHERARRGISIKLQVPNVYTELSVYENLWLAARLHYRDAAACQTAIATMLQTINLADEKSAIAGQLAHGQKQWLEIGMAAITQPQVLLLDEPTGGLSRGETLRTVALLNQLRQHVTIIVIEHDMEFVRQFNAEVIVLAQGQVLRTGRIETIQQDEVVRAVYLGQPHA